MRSAVLAVLGLVLFAMAPGCGARHTLHHDSEPPECVADYDCSDLDATCERGSCDLESGECRIIALTGGEPCDDWNDCTELDQCRSDGVCLGEPLPPTVLLDGGELPENQGWILYSTTVPTVTTDGTYLTFSTVDAPWEHFSSGPIAVYRLPLFQGLFRTHVLEWRMRLVSGDWNQFDAGAGFFPSALTEWLMPSDRDQMIYFDESAIGWADESGSFAVDTTAMHTYRLSLQADGSARVDVDGRLALERPELELNGYIAFGDQTNDLSYDGHMIIEYIHLLSADCL